MRSRLAFKDRPRLLQTILVLQMTGRPQRIGMRERLPLRQGAKRQISGPTKMIKPVKKAQPVLRSNEPRVEQLMASSAASNARQRGRIVFQMQGYRAGRGRSVKAAYRTTCRASNKAVAKGRPLDRYCHLPFFRRPAIIPRAAPSTMHGQATDHGNFRIAAICRLPCVRPAVRLTESALLMSSVTIFSIEGSAV